jgi:hypothetical protein
MLEREPAQHTPFHLPLKGGGRRPQAAGWGSTIAQMSNRHPNPPPFRGRERTARAALLEYDNA